MPPASRPLSMEERDWASAWGGRNFVAPAWITVTQTQASSCPKKKIFSPLKMGKPQKKDRTTRFITNVYIILVYISISPLSPLNKNKIYSIYHSTSHLSRNLTGKIIEINGAFSTLTPEGNHPKWEGGYFGTFLGVGYAFFDEYPLSFGNLRGFWKWIYR